jgi:hypothetical protein
MLLGGPVWARSGMFRQRKGSYKMSTSTRLKTAAIVFFLAVGLASGTPAKEAHGPVTATLKIDKAPAVFSPGESIAFRVVLKYTGDKPKVGFVEANRFWTFLFTPADGGVPRKAVLRVRPASGRMVPGGGPRPALPPLPLDNGKEKSQNFVLNQGGETAWWFEFADARNVPKEQKEKPLSQLPPGKYTLTATHSLPGLDRWSGKSPDNWYDPVTTNTVQIEISAKP